MYTLVNPLTERRWCVGHLRPREPEKGIKTKIYNTTRSFVLDVEDVETWEPWTVKPPCLK